MLKIIKRRSIQDLKKYFVGDFPSGDEDESLDHIKWFGSEIPNLTIPGKPPSMEDLEHLLKGCAPARPSVPLLPKDHEIVALEVLYMPPKSISIVGLFDQDVANAVVETFDQVIAPRIEEDAQVRDKRDGRDCNIPAPHLAGLRFSHVVSRSGDPHLNVHGIIASVVHDDTRDEYFSLEPSLILENQPIYAAVADSKLFSKLWSLRHRPVMGPNGPEIPDVPKDLIDAYSSRRREIVRRAAEIEQQVNALRAKRNLTPQENAFLKKWDIRIGSVRSRIAQDEKPDKQQLQAPPKSTPEIEQMLESVARSVMRAKISQQPPPLSPAPPDLVASTTREFDKNSLGIRLPMRIGDLIRKLPGRINEFTAENSIREHFPHEFKHGLRTYCVSSRIRDKAKLIARTHEELNTPPSLNPERQTPATLQRLSRTAAAIVNANATLTILDLAGRQRLQPILDEISAHILPFHASHIDFKETNKNKEPIIDAAKKTVAQMPMPFGRKVVCIENADRLSFARIGDLQSLAAACKVPFVIAVRSKQDPKEKRDREWSSDLISPAILLTEPNLVANPLPFVSDHLFNSLHSRAKGNDTTPRIALNQPDVLHRPYPNDESALDAAIDFTTSELEQNPDVVLIVADAKSAAKANAAIRAKLVHRGKLKGSQIVMKQLDAIDRPAQFQPSDRGGLYVRTNQHIPGCRKGTLAMVTALSNDTEMIVDGAPKQFGAQYSGRMDFFKATPAPVVSGERLLSDRLMETLEGKIKEDEIVTVRDVTSAGSVVISDQIILPANLFNFRYGYAVDASTHLPQQTFRTVVVALPRSLPDASEIVAKVNQWGQKSKTAPTVFGAAGVFEQGLEFPRRAPQKTKTGIQMENEQREYIEGEVAEDPEIDV